MARARGHQGLHLPDGLVAGHLGDQPARPGRPRPAPLRGGAAVWARRPSGAWPLAPCSWSPAFSPRCRWSMRRRPGRAAPDVAGVLAGGTAGHAVPRLVDRRGPRAQGRRPAGAGLAVALIVLSVLRAVHVGFLENPRRPAFAAVLPTDDWTSALAGSPSTRRTMPRDGRSRPCVEVRHGRAHRRRARRLPGGDQGRRHGHLLAAYGSATIARIGAASRSSEMDSAGLQRLAAAEGLTLVVTERPLDLPVLHASGAVRVYRLGS